MQTPKPQRRALPRWAVLVVILVTGTVTALALSASGLRGPQMAWHEASGTVDQVWGAAMTAEQQHLGAAHQGNAEAARQVAGRRGVPAILNGSNRPHGERGPCTNCHQVQLVPGVPMPNITSGAAMPHAFRGICGNCHLVGPRGSFGTAVAGTINAPVPPPLPPRLVEVDWLGLELRITAQANAQPGAVQPPGGLASPMGAMVTKAEGKAARSGVRRGDMITSINAVAMVDRNAFIRATQNGALRQGTVVALRNGQRLAFEIPQAAPPPAPVRPAALSPMAPGAMAPAAMSPALIAPQALTPAAPGPWAPGPRQAAAPAAAF